MSKVRTRFAPSPTGRMHVGNLRTALESAGYNEFEENPPIDGQIWLKVPYTKG